MMEIYNLDCFDYFDKHIEEKKSLVDCVIVDLPYGQTACKWDSVIDLELMWEALKKITKKGCVFVFFCSTKFGNSLINSNQKYFRYDLVWEKKNVLGFLSAKKLPMRKHEMVYIFSSPSQKSIYNPQMTEGKAYKKNRKNNKMMGCVYGDIKLLQYKKYLGTRYPISIQEFKADKKKLHPTQKPVPLCEWLIKSFSNEGDTILDFTMGSGSTGVACINTNRKFIGVEMNKEIFQVAKNRLEEKKILITDNIEDGEEKKE